MSPRAETLLIDQALFSTSGESIVTEYTLASRQLMLQLPGFSAALVPGPNNSIARLLSIFQNGGPESEMLRPIQRK